MPTAMRNPFGYVLVNSHLIHPPSNSWLLTLGILQTYPLSESFMIDFLMPYIHRLIDQPPLNHNRQKLISCHCTSGSFQEKKSGPFLVWYFIPGPIPCPGTLTHCLLDFWKIVFFKKRTEPPGKKLVVQRRVFYLAYLLTFYLAYLLAFYLANLLAFYLAVEVQRCTLSWEGPRLRSSSAHWAGMVPGWGPAVETELGRSQVEVRRCPLSWEGPRLRSSGAHWAGKVPGWGPAVHTELGRWRRAWRRVGKATVDVEVEAEVVEEMLAEEEQEEQEDS